VYVNAKIRHWVKRLPTLAAPKIQDAITSVCQQLELSYSYLPSRAGHDAQEIGRFADMGMIFGL
jgi:N-carbamoyl-L-amino-acid hydrolase